MSRRRRRQRLFWLALVMALSLSLLSSCAGGKGPLLSLADGEHSISPNGDGPDDETIISYSLGADASLNVWLEDGVGGRWPLRTEARRSAGSYELSFDGSVAGNAGERQVLPAGDYRLIFEASGAGQQARQESRISIVSPDTALPTPSKVAAVPETISPYIPGLQPETSIGYSLPKEATVTLLVEAADGVRTRVSAPIKQPQGEHAIPWNGLLRNKMPADGSYKAIVQARDAAGNVSEGSTTVHVTGTEAPNATIVNVVFSPTNVIPGDIVTATITVRNTGKVPLRSHGPESGYVYTTHEVYSTIEGGKYLDKANYWRVGVDWMGGLGAEGARYPYRWSLGESLEPGEEVTVEGKIRILESGPILRFYAGLVHEKVQFKVDKVGEQMIRVSK